LKTIADKANPPTVPIGIVNPQIYIQNVRSLSNNHLLHINVTADRKIGYGRLIIVKPTRIQMKLPSNLAISRIHPPKISVTQAILKTVLGLMSLNILIVMKVIGM